VAQPADNSEHIANKSRRFQRYREAAALFNLSLEEAEMDDGVEAIGGVGEAVEKFSLKSWQIVFFDNLPDDVLSLPERLAKRNDSRISRRILSSILISPGV
jgi:hypothetical protein